MTSSAGVLSYLKDHILCLDGGMGTLLQSRGLCPGETPERWNLSHPEEVTSIHRAYYDAGCHVVNTNTFGANRLHFSPDELEAVIAAAVANAKQARDTSCAPQEKFIALDIGPTGRLLRPFGDLDFEEAVSIFSQVVRLGVQNGVDLIAIETMNDSYETKAALLAARESCQLPVFVTNAYGEDGKLMTGATPEAMVALLESMGADAVGLNCSLGPRQLETVALSLLRHASVPVILKPNAGLPQVEPVTGRTVYDVDPEEFAGTLTELVRQGVRVVGGCCGTTPDYIRALSDRVRALSPQLLPPQNETVVTSYTHAVTFGNDPILIGERINPTGKKRFRQALLAHDLTYVLQEGLHQAECGVHILDVNVGLPEIDETALLTETVEQLQAVTDLPLQIDTASPAAMESALRRYNGKALINSVNGKAESMAAIFPLVKKYGGAVIALTLDENGIPATAGERVRIAEKIKATAATYGISPKDLIFDPLALTVSADPQAATVTCESLRGIRREVGCHTSLGVSNVSFGLPCRDAVNTAFFAAALENGLSAAIMNPYSQDMMKTYFAYRALHGLDPDCGDYIAFCQTLPAPSALPQTGVHGTGVSMGTGMGNGSDSDSGSGSPAGSLGDAICRGLRDAARELTVQLLRTQPPLTVIDREIIPALDRVGRGYEAKTVFLPQLLMSAEAAQNAFRVIQEASLPLASVSDGQEKGTTAMTVLLATVQGDIHDIGKNIVRLLLENYGFRVLDLGRDVAPETVVAQVLTHHVPLVGLSALMTTTVPAMAETIRQLHEKAPFCRVVVGGAVLDRDYAARIHADRYAKDAMETVRYAEQVRSGTADDQMTTH